MAATGPPLPAGAASSPDSRPAPPGSCISATPIRRCSAIAWREAAAAAASCSGSRTSTPAAAAPNSRPPSRRTSPGSASNGSGRCAANPSTWASTARRSTGSRRAACSTPASAPAPRSRARSRPPAMPRTGRTARAIPAPAAACPRPSATRGSRAARRTRSASTWRRRWPRCLPRGLSFTELGEGRLPADPAPFGDVVLARKDVPASYHLCVCHDDAAPGRHGGDARRRPEARDGPAPAAASACWAGRSRSTPTTRCCPIATGRRLAKREGAPAIRALRQAGHSPAAVRAMAGFADHDD